MHCWFLTLIDFQAELRSSGTVPVKIGQESHRKRAGHKKCNGDDLKVLPKHDHTKWCIYNQWYNKLNQKL